MKKKLQLVNFFLIMGKYGERKIKWARKKNKKGDTEKKRKKEREGKEKWKEGEKRKEKGKEIEIE